MRAKLERQKEERRQARIAASGGTETPRKPSALDRFKRAAES